MKIITISGSHSGAGKTMLAENILKKLKGWAALKVTVLREGPCPIAKNCGACEKLDSNFSIISDKKTIEEKGKDTARLKASGAGKVLWLKAKPKGLKEGLKTAMNRFKGAKGVIVEGTSALEHLKGDLAIFVKGKDAVLKPSARKAIKKADLVLTWKD